MFRIVRGVTLLLLEIRLFAPTNIVLRMVRRRRGLKWGPLVGAIGVIVFGGGLYVFREAILEGGPGWLNLFVLLFLWNAFKLFWTIPLSLLRLAVARRREAADRRRQRAQAAQLAAHSAESPELVENEGASR